MTAGKSPSWPAVTLAQADALLCAPGAKFEMETLEVYGRPVRVWKNGPKSLMDVFQAAHAFGDLTFLVHQDERISFDAFARAVMAFARLLVARGVRPGERVALAMRNLPEWPVAFYGAALAGAVVTPLNAWWSAGELDYALRDSGAVAGVFDAERYERVRERLAGCGGLREVFVCRRAGPATEGTLDFEDAVGRPAAWGDLPPVGDLLPPVNPEDDATLFYTSGTTGEP
jgi:long-chain acyl-CoA synthetase